MREIGGAPRTDALQILQRRGEEFVHAEEWNLRFQIEDFRLLTVWWLPRLAESANLKSEF